jgi:hypothetical protein
MQMQLQKDLPRMRIAQSSLGRAACLVSTAALLVLAMALGCDVERRKSDTELGLTPQQSAGRKIYDSRCDRCHEPYSTRGKKGPGLK